MLYNSLVFPPFHPILKAACTMPALRLLLTMNYALFAQYTLLINNLWESIMWEDISPTTNASKLYSELAAALGKAMLGAGFHDSEYLHTVPKHAVGLLHEQQKVATKWAVMPSVSRAAHINETFNILIEDIIKALRHDNPQFNEALFRSTLLKASRLPRVNSSER